MNEEELKKEIEKRKKAVRDRGVMEDDLREYKDYEYSPESWWDGEIMILERELIAFQKGKLEQKKEELELLVKINGLWFDDEEKGMINIIQKRIKQLSKEIGEEKEK